MCRLLMLVGTNLAKLSLYIDSFVKASECDLILADYLKRSKCENHSDGWGYAVVGIRDSGEKISTHYRSTTPVYRDFAGVESLKSVLREIRVGVVIAHSRKSAEGSVKIGNTHPIYYSWKGFEMWIAHNGVVDSDGLSRTLGIAKLLDTTDTYYLGEFVYRYLDSVDVEKLAEALKSAAKYTKTAMNTLTTLFNGEKAVSSITFYLAEQRARDSLAVKYYKILTREFENSRVFFSSSLLSYLSDTDAGEIPQQTAVLVELDLNTGKTNLKTHSLSTG
ncbi:MAG: class II glutamine amidotransferase [Sulfolobales archaeon]|nr:class II glutamine amidotransferase [Sulfolobales archaeon]MDW8083468.1 class II glutamine amidotransferase [Sulfolobales archaeon]